MNMKLINLIVFIFILKFIPLSSQCSNSSIQLVKKGFDKTDVVDLKESIKSLNNVSRGDLLIYFKPSYREIYDSAWDFCLANKLLDCRCNNIRIIYFKPEDVENKVLWRNNKFYFRESPAYDDEIPFTENYVRLKCVDSGLMTYLSKEFNLKRSSRSDYYNLNIKNLRLGAALMKLNQIISSFESMKAAYENEKRFLYINNKLDSVLNKDKLLLDSILKITRKIPRCQRELSLTIGYGKVFFESTAFRQFSGISRTCGFDYRTLRIPTYKSENRVFFGNSLKIDYNRSNLTVGTTFNEGHEDIGIYNLNNATVSLPYRRLAYYNGIKEKVRIDNFNVGIGKTVSIVNKNRNRKTFGKLAKAMLVDFSAGVLLNVPLRATYNASAGSLSWGGIFEAYNESDTMFSGLYDFATNVLVNDKVQKLNVNNFNLGLYADLLFRLYLGKKNTGCIILGLSGNSIKTAFFSGTADDKFNYDNDKYNSLLYRKSSKALYLNTLNFKLGYSLCF